MDNVVLTSVRRECFYLIRSLLLKSLLAFVLLAKMFDAWLYYNYDQLCVTGHLICRAHAQGLMSGPFHTK
jgi:hypothetical protein